MVELLFDGFKGGIEIAKVHYPSSAWINRTADKNLDLKRMAVQIGARVRIRQPRQFTGSLDVVDVIDFHLFFSEQFIQRISGVR